jgi:hypothetical protein
MFEALFAKIAGKYLASKLNLQEGAPMPSKPWYRSLTIWSDVFTILLAAVGFVDKYWTHGLIAASPFYAMALTIAGSLGIYGRTTATTTISS